MDANNTRVPDFFMEIREVLNTLGDWNPDSKAGRKVINRFVSILDAGIADPRVKGRTSYPLSEVIVLSFFAILGGAVTFQDIEVMCTCKLKYYRKFIPLKAGIPSHDTFNRVFSLMDMAQFDKALSTFIREALDDLRKALGIAEPPMIQVCIDGKEARASGRQADADGKVTSNIQTFHAYSTFHGICLRSSQIEQKSNEIPMAQKILGTMNLDKTLVSFDAMNTQRKTVQVIIDQGGHYLGGLKGNQKTLLQESAAYFTPDYLKKAETDLNLYYKTIEKAHGQIEECIYTVAKVKVTDDCEFSDWPGMKAVIRFDKRTEKVNTGKKSEETRYYITSLDKDARVCGQSIREHWQIENSLHGHLDMMFCDDENTTVNRRASGNLSILKKMSLSLYKMMKPIENSKTLSNIKRKFAWGYEDMLERMLSSCDGKTIQKNLDAALKKKKE